MFETLKEDSWKGDFIYQTKSDKIALDIDLSDEKIQVVAKGVWKNFLNKKTKAAAFMFLIEEILNKEYTKDINFQSQYAIWVILPII